MEQMLKQILNEIKTIKTDISELKQGQAKLEQGQARLEANQAKLEAGQQDIRRELNYIWSDIKRLDTRLSQQEQETYVLKRMK
ncbi:MAG: hypothetical protein PWQ37_2883 [Candidatus Petromonas sp.]|jgi:septal ring factor EnvC (AmiA/AmiB activator)|nr:hypothetical protein [Candidatus Petromonas sp.]